MAVLDWNIAISPTEWAAHTTIPFTATLTVQAPACNPGDLLVLAAMGTCTSGPYSTAVPSAPAGWTARSAGGAALGVWTKTAVSADVGASYVVSFSPAAAGSVVVASLPAGTIAGTSFQASGTDVRTYTPTFPGTVNTDDTVLMFGGVVTPYTFFGGSANLKFPSGWTWEIPPVSPVVVLGISTNPSTPTAALGLASFRGPGPSDMKLPSTTKSQFYAGFLVVTTTLTEPSWLRVTATGTGTPAPNSVVAAPTDMRMALTVKALSGADTPANTAALGATAAKTAPASTGNGEVTLTPARSGSLIYGAVTQSGAPGATIAMFSSAPGTVFSQNVADNGLALQQASEGYGTFQTSAPVTAGSAVTVGAAGSTGPIQVAAAEIFAASTLAETASASVATHYPWEFRGPAATSQTAIFTSLPPAGTVLVAMVSWAHNNSGTGTTVALSDSSGMQWTELVSQQGSNQGYAGVWVAQYGVVAGPPGVPTGLQVTGVSDTTLTLSWIAPAQGPVTGYDAYVNGMANSTAATTTATVAGLSPNTTYSLAVDAFNANGRSSQTTAVPGTTSGGPPPPPQSTGAGCLFGLRPVPSAGVSPETSFAGSVIAREVLLGRKADIITTWRNWDPATQTTTAELQCIQGGRLPLLTWPLPASVPAGANAAITAGTYDAIIYGWGQKIAALGGRVLFRPLPDANADPNFGPAPATFITSWQRIWTIIKGTPAQFAALSPACTAGPALSAANVDFVWAMAQRPTVAAGGHLWASYFPGGAYVDWIALDTYNLSPATQMIGTLITTGDFVSTGSSHNWYATYVGSQQPGGSPIPLMISETGCREADDPGVAGQPFSKAIWLAQAQALLQNYPAVRAVVYTDAVLPTGDWRLDTSPGPAVIIDDPQASPTLAAAIAWAGDPYFDRRMKVLTDGAADLYLAGDPPGN